VDKFWNTPAARRAQQRREIALSRHKGNFFTGRMEKPFKPRLSIEEEKALEAIEKKLRKAPRK